MAATDDANDCTASTTWVWRRVRVSTPPQAQQNRPSGARSLSKLGVWPRRKTLHLEVKYRGGPEAWYEIRARGVTLRMPGATALHDVMRTLYNDGAP